MKKLLLLGGSAQQIIAIETAKRLGYYTVLCDYLPDNPGQYHADKFYLVSTTDKDAVLDVAQKENIDGVLAYASDPAAPTAAYVSEKLGLPGNPYGSVEILCNKDQFRSFLRTNGYNTPFGASYNSLDDLENDINLFELPVILKPTDSSGSKGVSILRSWDNVGGAVGFALSFSRSHRFIVEEYIEKSHLFLIGGDIFISDGQVIMWGLMNCHRDNAVNPLVPIGKSYPLELSEEDLKKVKETLSTLVSDLKIKNCSMNVELVLDKKGRVFPIDIGPRCGGNMIPDLLGMIFNVDVIKMSVEAAMGKKIGHDLLQGSGFYATYNLHALKSGVFNGISYSDRLKKYIVKECIYKKVGEPMQFFDNASKALGIIFLRFSSKEEMFRVMKDINQDIIFLEAPQ